MHSALLKMRARFVQLTRAYFIERGYLEVETPVLAPFLIPESSIEVFRTSFLAGDASPLELYLVPSPELWMKRLLAGGSGSLFQITKAFRNIEALGRQHSPEFSLLEWYTVGHGYLDSIEVLEGLLAYLARGMDTAWQPTLPCARRSVAEAFGRYAGLAPEQLLSREALLTAAGVHGLRVDALDTFEVLFNSLFVSLVEPELPDERGLVLLDYPDAIPTTARARGGLAERWEFYARGVEVANCYGEENDRQRLRNLFAEESRRKQNASVPHRVDESLPDILAAGLPVCSGVALGMDRLFMLLSGETSIERVLSFPFSKY